MVEAGGALVGHRPGVASGVGGRVSVCMSLCVVRRLIFSFQTFFVFSDFRFQTVVHPARRKLRPPTERLLFLQLVPLQPVGLQLPLPPGRTLPEVGQVDAHPPVRISP